MRPITKTPRKADMLLFQIYRPFILSDAQKSFEEKSADSNRLFLMEYDVCKVECACIY